MKKLSGATAIVIYSGVLAFAAIAVIALQLGAEEFGKSAYIQALALWLSFGCTLGLPYQMRQELALAGQEPVRLYRHGSNFLILTLVVCGIFPLAALATGFLSFQETLLTVLYCVAHSVFTLDQSYDLGRRKYVLYARKQAEYVTVANIGCVIHLYVFDVGWEYRIIYQVVGLLVPMLIRSSNLSFFLPRRRKHYSAGRQILERSLFVSAHSSVDKVYTHLDKIIIWQLFGDKILGFYALAVTLASSINLITKMPFAHYEQKVLGSIDLRTTNKLFLHMSVLLLGAALLFGAAAALVPDQWLELPVFADFPYAKTLVITSGFYVSAKLIFALTFPRFLRLRLERRALWFDLALAIPLLGLSSLAAVTMGAEAFQLAASLGFIAIAVAAIIYTNGKARAERPGGP